VSQSFETIMIHSTRLIPSTTVLPVVQVKFGLRSLSFVLVRDLM
jgi:hypothetical protein